MEGISDIKIIGIDEQRPPKIRKEPYIDIVFKLSHKAPADWCKDLNGLMSQHSCTPKIKEAEGLYIEAWVRTPDEIDDVLEQLKENIATCTNEYIERIERSYLNTNDANATTSEEEGEQGRLNKIIASLNYDDAITL